MLVEQVELNDSVTGSVLIPRSKSDVHWKGRLAYLSLETTELLNRWIEEADLITGPLFRSLTLGVCTMDRSPRLPSGA